MNYYVYYKVKPEHVEALRPGVRELFSTIEKRCGVRGRWMRRRDDRGTFMEVYEDVRDAAGFEAVLERESAKLGLQRKLERFVSAETPA